MSFWHHLLSVLLVTLASTNCWLQLVPCEIVNHVLGLLGAVGVVQLHRIHAAKAAARLKRAKRPKK